MSVASGAAQQALPSDVAWRYQALIRLAEALRSHPDPVDLFKTLAQQMQDFVSFDSLAQFDGAANRVRWHFVDEYRTLEDFAAPEPPRTAPYWVHQHQEPLLLRIAEPDARFPYIERLGKLGLASLYVVPLRTAHCKLGSLAFGSHLDDAYSPEEQSFLSLVADQIALAMDDALNFQASRWAQERLKLLLDLTNRIVSKLDLPELLQEIAMSIRHTLQCNSVAVALPDPENNELHVWARAALGREEIVESPQLLKISQQVFRTGQPVNVSREQLAADPIVAPEGLMSLRLLPLVSHRGALGVLGLGSSRENPFAEDDLSFLGQAANQVALAIENALAYRDLSELKEKFARENVYLESEIRSELQFDDIVGTSDALKRVLGDIETVAPADSTVLIYGETGTGKELIARAVHNLSSRRANTFVKLNCAAIPTGLLESELFGHEKGAFTGAISQRIGRFELAHRGTMFLDEIGEVPLELQPKLLRVLQEREFERLGSARTVRIDARLIAATNRDLKTMVDEQKFRSDLYYRLNVFPIRVPALRERSDDIHLLVRHFVHEFSRRNNKAIDTIPSEAMEALVRYHWPGNIRELQNVIERAVIVSRGPVLSVAIADLKFDVDRKPVASNHERLQDLLDETERTHIVRVLEATNWVVAGPNGAAARLGMNRTTLQARMQKLGIRVARTGLKGA
jgi:formate hydrogenlyase transcriptional activator